MSRQILARRDRNGQRSKRNSAFSLLSRCSSARSSSSSNSGYQRLNVLSRLRLTGRAIVLRHRSRRRRARSGRPVSTTRCTSWSRSSGCTSCGFLTREHPSGRRGYRADHVRCCALPGIARPCPEGSTQMRRGCRLDSRIGLALPAAGPWCTGGAAFGRPCRAGRDSILTGVAKSRPIPQCRQPTLTVSNSGHAAIEC